MIDLARHARFALRYFNRNRGFAAAGIALVALGVSLSATLFAIVNGALLRPWPYAGYDRIVTVRGNYPEQGRTGFSLWSAAEIADLRRESDVFSFVVAGDARNVNLTFAGRAERVRAAILTPDAFEMLAVPTLMGRTLDASDASADARVVVVSFQFWRTRLGAARDIVGRTLRIADAPYTIVGVMPERFRFWDRDLWMPLAPDPSPERSLRRYYVQGQLAPGLDAAGAARRLQVVTARWRRDHPEVGEYRGASISLNRLVDDVLRDLRPTLYLLLAAVALVIVVSSANLANAMLAKGVSREGEMAVRRALGASRVALAAQMAVEAGMVAALGSVAGATAAAFLLPQVVALVPYGYIPAEARVDLDWTVALAATACAIVTSIGFGLVPALQATAVDAGAVLKRSDIRTGSRAGSRWRDAFTVAQLALAVIVLAVAAAAFAGLRSTLRRSPGFDSDDLWTGRIALESADAARRSGAATYAAILARIADAGGVREAAAASTLPVGSLPGALVSRGGVAGPVETIDAGIMAVSPTFFRVLHIAIAEGRPFRESDRSDAAAAAIVSAGLARVLWPGAAAVGHQLTIASGGDPIRAIVVGIAGDVRTNPADAGVRPIVYVPLAQEPPASAAIVVRSRDPRQLTSTVAGALAAVDARIPLYDARMLDDVRIAASGPQLLAVVVLGLFGLASLALSAVGTFAVMSHSVRERAGELRIRLALGAEPGRLFARELRRSGRVIAVSASIGGCGAAAAERALAATLPSSVAAPGPATALAVVVVTVLALVATAIPARRAVTLFSRPGRSVRLS
jgi:predicted permease